MTKNETKTDDINSLQRRMCNNVVWNDFFLPNPQPKFRTMLKYLPFDFRCLQNPLAHLPQATGSRAAIVICTTIEWLCSCCGAWIIVLDFFFEHCTRTSTKDFHMMKFTFLSGSSEVGTDSAMRSIAWQIKAHIKRHRNFQCDGN